MYFCRFDTLKYRVLNRFFLGGVMKNIKIFLFLIASVINVYGAQSKRDISPLTDVISISVQTQPKPFKLTAVEKARNRVPTVQSLQAQNGIALYQKQLIISLFVQNQDYVESHFCNEQLQDIFNRQEVAMHRIKYYQRNMIDHGNQDFKGREAQAFVEAYWHGIMFRHAITKIK